MTNVLYIGNQLQAKHGIPTTIDTLSRLLHKEGCSVITASSKSHKLSRLWDMCWHVVKYRSKVDVVLIDTYSTQNFWYALLVSQLCRMFSLPYISILHGGNLPKRLKRNPRPSRWIFKNAKHLVSPSLFLQEQFKAYGYSSVHIPNNLELEKYRFQQRTINVIKLLWVRSFSDIYNPKMAVEVLKQLKDLGYEAALCMVGPEKDGSLETTRLYAESLGLKILFTGGLSKDAWIELSKDYNVFINTTNFDNMPVSVVEAMALGLPVVSTNVGGLPYLLESEKEGLLVDKGAIDQMVTAIIRLKETPEMTLSMSAMARQKAETYNWTIVKAQWFSLFKEC